MKALVMETYKSLLYKDVPEPVLTGAHDMLVRVKAVSICGSDVHGFDGSTGRRRPPVIMGHEASGEIVQIGDEVTDFAVGDRVTFDSTIYCGACRFCRSGDMNLCDNRKVLGVSCEEYRQDGAFAEYVLIPDRIAFQIPEGLSFVEAAMTEPAGVAAHAARITPIGLGESMAVVGSGLIGLLLIQVLRASTSGIIIALDTDEKRREASLRFGAHVALDPADVQLQAKIAKEIGPGGGTVVRGCGCDGSDQDGDLDRPQGRIGHAHRKCQSERGDSASAGGVAADQPPRFLRDQRRVSRGARPDGPQADRCDAFGERGCSHVGRTAVVRAAVWP